MIQNITFHHVGIFVNDIQLGFKYLQNLIPIHESSEIFDDKNLRVSVQFFADESGLLFELVAPYLPNNPVDNVLRNGKNILNHIAYKTKCFDKTLLWYRENGCFIIGEPKAALAFKQARVAFVLTKLNLIIELIEDRST